MCWNKAVESVPMHTVTTAFDESPRHCHVRAVPVLSVTTEKFMSKPQQISDCSRRRREPIRRAPSSDSVGRRASCMQCRGCVSVLGPCHARACHRFHCRNPSNLRAATVHQHYSCRQCSHRRPTQHNITSTHACRITRSAAARSNYSRSISVYTTKYSI